MDLRFSAGLLTHPSLLIVARGWRCLPNCKKNPVSARCKEITYVVCGRISQITPPRWRLREFGGEIQIESLADAALAHRRLEEGGVDILLTDLEMPGVNGLALLRRAKRRNAYTQVLFITGHSTQEALLDALELGATDYLLKPIQHQEVLHVIRQAHERQQRWQQALAGTWQQRRELAIGP